jgi:hypothetical protein
MPAIQAQFSSSQPPIEFRVALRGVFIVDAIMPQPTPSGKLQPALRQRACRNLFRPAE